MIVYVYMYYMLVRLSGCFNYIKGTIIIVIIIIITLSACPRISLISSVTLYLGYRFAYIHTCPNTFTHLLKSSNTIYGLISLISFMPPPETIGDERHNVFESALRASVSPLFVNTYFA